MLRPDKVNVVAGYEASHLTECSESGTRPGLELGTHRFDPYHSDHLDLNTNASW